MSEEFQKKLFDPFSQEDDANARTQYKGTGLGMA
jgi:signal transduction histidine kinase